MFTKESPGEFDCHANALPDEPMFVLLARDPTAPGYVRDWANFRERSIQIGNRPLSDMDKVWQARDCARAMEVWRQANNGKWRKP